jgi:hypothetical protein
VTTRTKPDRTRVLRPSGSSASLAASSHVWTSSCLVRAIDVPQNVDVNDSH